jgi:pimeloyl-ACP methyl ester carboxylesterase
MNNFNTELEITLSDGRRLTYAEFGDDRGIPVLYCHGFPGSRMEAQLMHQAASQLGIRVIAPDRPGFGGSDPCPERLLTDWAIDILALAEHLDIESIRLIGLSGGAPYAMACAARLGARVSAISLVCPLAPLSHASNMDVLNWSLQLGFATAQIAPWMNQMLLNGWTRPFALHHPDGLFLMLLATLPAIDQRALSKPEARLSVIASIRESLKPGASGANRDMQLYASEWEFDLANIHQLVKLWHGTADQVVPLDHAHWYASTLPHCESHLIDGEGHYSLPINYLEPILQATIEGA